MSEVFQFPVAGEFRMGGIGGGKVYYCPETRPADDDVADANGWTCYISAHNPADARFIANMLNRANNDAHHQARCDEFPHENDNPF